MDRIEIVWQVGPFGITRTVITTFVLVVLIAAGARVATRRLTVEHPGPLQSALEGMVQAIDAAIAAVLPAHARLLLPFVGTLWIFVAAANLIGLIPGAHAPTGDLSTTAALALVVFCSVHWYGIRAAGLTSYLRHYLAPSPLLLPFHLLGELSRTLALAVRLFGNIMSLEMAALLILLVAGLLVPVPVLMLHVVEALVQAYIFGMLALIYIAGGLQAQAVPPSSGTDTKGTTP